MIGDNSMRQGKRERMDVVASRHAQAASGL
jgi:hypothetical protein